MIPRTDIAVYVHDGEDILPRTALSIYGFLRGNATIIVELFNFISSVRILYI